MRRWPTFFFALFLLGRKFTVDGNSLEGYFQCIERVFIAPASRSHIPLLWFWRSRSIGTGRSDFFTLAVC
jgi:hypothetical protein